MVRERPVTDKEFKAVLKECGFERRPQKSGTSHEQWVRSDERGFHRVTVDPPKQPYHRDLLAMMLRQAGLSKREFFRILDSL